jgi:hypothetical protein
MYVLLLSCNNGNYQGIIYSTLLTLHLLNQIIIYSTLLTFHLINQGIIYSIIFTHICEDFTINTENNQCFNLRD